MNGEVKLFVKIKKKVFFLFFFVFFFFGGVGLTGGGQGASELRSESIVKIKKKNGGGVQS